MKRNPLIDPMFIDYLEAQGYPGSWSDDKSMWTGIARDKAVQIKDDTITFFTYCEGEDDRAPEFSRYGQVVGLSQFDFFKFQLICHCFDVVPIKSFLQKVRQQEPDLMEDLFKHFTPSELVSNY